MDDITLNLIVLAVFLVIGGAIFFIVRRKQAQNEQEIINLAVEKGWRFEKIREPLAWGLRLASPRWTLEAISRSSGQESGPGSSDVSALTTWRADSPGSTFLIGPRTSQASLGAMGDMLTRQVLHISLGADASGLDEVPLGSEAFGQKYMVWAQNPSDVRISSAIESILLGWKDPRPVIKRTSQGLVVEVKGARLSTAAELSTLVQLGEIFL